MPNFRITPFEPTKEQIAAMTVELRDHYGLDLWHRPDALRAAYQAGLGAAPDSDHVLVPKELIQKIVNRDMSSPRSELRALMAELGGLLFEEEGKT